MTEHKHSSGLTGWRRAATLLITTAFFASALLSELPDNLSKNENLVAWCIVPFDAKKRGPKERAEMLKELGILRCAYDWRGQHVPTFEDEILQYKKQGIEFFAFWSAHEKAFQLFEKYKISPQIWMTLGSPRAATQEEKVLAAARSMIGMSVRTKKIGSKLGLYNHGGWGGEPKNMVAVCKRLRELGHSNVGIVYNFHHGHGHIDGCAESFALMKPYLLCLNLNGMNTGAKPKILGLGKGQHDLQMLQAVVESGYDGPVGILDHRSHLDARDSLQENLDGLEWLRKELIKPGSGGPRPQARQSVPPASQPSPNRASAADSVNETFGKALSGGILMPGKEEFRKPPITVECRARLKDAKGYNILIASDPKSITAHWEIFSMHGAGTLTAYIPGAVPDHVRSKARICDGKWHAIAMQYEPGRVRLWLDGKVVADTKIKLKPRSAARPNSIGIGRLVSGRLGCRGAIDEVRITRGTREDLAQVPDAPFSKGEDGVLGHWNFDDLKPVPEAIPQSFNRKPLEPEANPYWEAHINRFRVYDFYAKQALHYGKLEQTPHLLPHYPGLDGGKLGHWGYQNDQNTWKDGRIRETDTGSVVSGVFRGGGHTVPRGVSVLLGDKGELAACFNPDTLTFEVVWEGGFIKWSDARHGLMGGTPMDGKVVMVKPKGHGWEGVKEFKYQGFYRSGRRVIFCYELDDTLVFDSAWAKNGKFSRVIEFPDGPDPAKRLIIGRFRDKQNLRVHSVPHPTFSNKDAKGAKLVNEDGLLALDLSDTGANLIRIEIGPTEPERLTSYTLKRTAQWRQTIVTQGILGKGQPYAIDTLTLPYENPWKSLFFVGGHDFLPDGRIAVCTIHGEVWICSGVSQTLERLEWRRFAAGLHQPLGLKVVDGKIHVLGRDQITKLYDGNKDGEADVYECVSNAHQTSTGGHDYIAGLQRDEAGRFYFASGNQGLCRTSADGKTVEVLATGFRNPNGLGINRDGSVILTSVQEGEWTPASAICDIVKGGHYGHGGPRTGKLGYVPPMLYLPRGVDNSCGGQAFIDSDRWGPVSGNWVHFASGMCTHFLILREVIGGQSQAAAIPLRGEFLSGAHRGRFSPKDGQLYVSGAQGWVNYGTRDGCLQRVRYTGGDFDYPIGYETRDNGILLKFTEPVKDALAQRDRWFAQQWSYQYSSAYGSLEYSVRHPGQPGHDAIEIRSVHRTGDGRQVFIEMPQLNPVNVLHLHGGGEPRVELFITIHALGTPFTDFPGYKAIPKVSMQNTKTAKISVEANPWVKGKAGRGVTVQAAAGLRFEPRRFSVKAGERISLTFENPDAMPHNFVLGALGTFKELGNLANKLMADPTAIKHHYVPKSPKVLAYTNVLHPKQKQTIHFNAPGKPGEYPYLCTFPGHWMVMNGVMVVE
jgi:azurin